MTKHLYAITVYPKENDIRHYRIPLRLKFDSYDAAEEAANGLKKEGFEVCGLNDYPLSLYTAATVSKALEDARTWLER